MNCLSTLPTNFAAIFFMGVDKDKPEYPEMNLLVIQEQFQSEHDCCEWLFHTRWPNGILWNLREVNPPLVPDTVEGKIWEKPLLYPSPYKAAPHVCDLLILAHLNLRIYL